MAVDPEQARDGGFTLLELIVVVLLVAVLASVMVAVVAVIIRNAPATEARADNSRSYQGLVTWLRRDVASTPPQKFKIDAILPTAPAWSCAGAPGPALVEMSWNQQGIAYVAGYVVEPDGDGWQVVRYACQGPDTPAAPLPGVSTRNVTGRLHAADAIPIAPGRIKMELTTCGETDRRPDCGVAGPVIVVETSSRNPAATLPP